MAEKLHHRIMGSVGQAVRAVSPKLHRRYMRLVGYGPLQGPLAEDLVAEIDALIDGADPHATIARVARRISRAVLAGELDAVLDRPRGRRSNLTLIGTDAYLPRQRWRMRAYFIEEGHSHPPHMHGDLVSCLTVARGVVRAREYEREGPIDPVSNTVPLRLAADRMMRLGDHLETTEGHRNAHWFGAIDGPAVAINFQCAGFRRGERPIGRVRSHVDPTAETVPGARFAAPLMRKGEAIAKFAGRPISDFVPG